MKYSQPLVYSTIFVQRHLSTTQCKIKMSLFLQSPSLLPPVYMLLFIELEYSIEPTLANKTLDLVGYHESYVICRGGPREGYMEIPSWFVCQYNRPTDDDVSRWLHPCGLFKH